MEQLSDYLAENGYLHGTVAITGAGGKTSLLCLMARKAKEEGKAVLVTTSTKIQHPDAWPYPPMRSCFRKENVIVPETKGGIVFFAEEFEPKKCKAPKIDDIGELAPSFDLVLIEADGARHLPLKLHTERDPVIPSFTDSVIAVVGVSSFGKPIEETVFGDSGEGLVDIPYLQRLLDEREGVTKGFKQHSLIIVNQCDIVTDLSSLRTLRSSWPIVFASVERDRIY
jgi:hypothetical protein